MEYGHPRSQKTDVPGQRRVSSLIRSRSSGDTKACKVAVGDRNGQRSWDRQRAGRLGGAVLFLRDGSSSQDDDKNSLGEEAVEVLRDWLQG